jgi:uncharacterized protein (DUF58 family)
MRTAATSSPAAPDTLGTIYVDTQYLMHLEQYAHGISLRQQQAHSSVLSGRHASRIRGRGLDFSELRAYIAGDDIRTVDWKASLRAGNTLVRAYTEERDRPLLLIVDQRIAMFFGSRRAMKSVIAAELAALCAWAALRGGDRIGAIVFDDTQCRHIRPLRSRAQAQFIFHAIAELNNAMHAESSARMRAEQLNSALKAALNVAHHDHLIVVISDFTGSDARTLQLLRELRAHNDVVGALIFDPLVHNFPHGGRLIVSEGELQIEIDLGKTTVHEPLTELFETHFREIAELLRRSGIPLLAFDTEQRTIDQLRYQLGRFAPAGRKPR